MVAVAAGGLVGSLLRWGLVESGWLGSAETATVVVNVVGSLLLGGLLGQRERLGPELRLGLGTGFAGGLTTFSSYAVAVAGHLDDGALGPAAANGLGTPVAALLAAGLGYRLSRIWGIRSAPSGARRGPGGRG